MPIAESLIAGYIATIVAYMVLMLLVTRLGRSVLMDGDCVSKTYTLLLCGTWLGASAAGAYVCCGMSPLAPYGTVLFPCVLAVGSLLVVRRNMQQLPGQQSASATAGVCVMIAAGTLGGLYLRHALTL